MKTQRLLKRMVGPFMIRGTKLYVKQNRTTSLFGLTLYIPSGIFNPRLFFSTKTMGLYLKKLPLKSCNLLEIGSGSGALSILAARLGATVMATDINPLAVNTTKHNAKLNNVTLEVIETDLFHQIPIQPFQFIINNPPYYPKNPTTLEEHAWFSGEGHAYFDRLFNNVSLYLKNKGKLLLVLSDDCDLVAINKKAANAGLTFQKIYVRNHWIEKTHIWEYQIAN